MNEEYVDLPLVKNTEDKRFELKIGDYITFIDYKEHDKKIWLIHTEAPAELQGKGAATAVIEKTLAYIEENGYTLIPICPLVAAYLKRHPDWNRILDPSVKPH
ncbi:GNAT family N-acetyltransferase [Pedobacter steynii]|uniref:GNAT family N-acetyltransferase n=1 Tax=Pedobacter steynii TaxID=430522 RepID=A0A1D7QJF9_9SPHI|nr:GNAT family N-acetyltransferase [Pedobacter steynii]AOM78802.1 GNAT family N-acetyltransferase [Pedobacter steynii]